MIVKVNRRAVIGAAVSALAWPAMARAQALPADVPVEAFAAFPKVDQIALSPDGKRIALISQNQDNKVLLYFDIADQKPQYIVLGTVKPRALLWADNNHVVVYTTQSIGPRRRRSEKGLATVFNLTTGKSIILFEKRSGRYPAAPQEAGLPVRVLTPGGYKLLAATQPRGVGCLFQLFGMDDPNGQTVYEGRGYLNGVVMAPDGHLVAISEADSVHNSWQLKFNRAPSGETPKFEVVHTAPRDDQEEFWPWLGGLGRDGESVVLTVCSEDGEWRYHEMSPAGVLGPALEATGGDDAVSALYHPVTRRLAGFAAHDDWFRYDVFDPLLKKLTDGLPIVMGKEYRWSITDYAEDPRKMIVYGESAQDPGTYYFCDFTTGDVKTIYSNYPELPEDAVTEKQPFDYKAADGLGIHAYLTLPRGSTPKNLPLVVLVHGGPEARDYAGFDWQAQCLASRGYAVLQPNFRGSSGYGEAFVRAGDGEVGRKMQTDLSDGVRHLVAQGIADPRRVAIMGASYGGYAALAGATLDQGVYRCAVSVAGISDITYYAKWLSPEYHSGQVWLRRLGDPAGHDDISPARRAAWAYCPILLIHGEDDSVVKYEHSVRMEKALKAAGKPVEFLTLKGQDHWETVSTARIQMMETILRFLSKHNPAG
jgi:dipeptidyl aminopeptidase/acylaminoacyl peptidase